ncbi:MetQ/NlpA family ABC transporter substrate-binding protein [Campylobacter mucosalis]|uniref:DL-methionine ABC transporter MetINQ, substrate-binding protein n=1 Tax=Campylobacter mucosalis CCUG 21559 TaxID=1032067 RepID=A0A6G5QGU5_9BACT|nr:MetQ/NlpA family ABC transporter substrate-binding protein [Campylobacter mucosalis]QCD44915.1 DL-methionine ABC transporter MetINQ, substrate-binding protein [Campylobacter mucosalis CCUG 21559]
MKILKLAIAFLTALNLNAKSDEKTIVVGVSPVPHAEILEVVKPKLKEQGYELVISEITDYSIPNIATNDGDLDANFFQHEPYLNEHNKNRNTDLVKVVAVHLEPLGFYSNKIKNINELKDNATIAIAHDPTNGNRALRILQDAGLITLDESAVLATPADIVKNPKGLKFVEIEGALIPRSLNDVDLAAISTNFVLDMGLNPSKDALIIESTNSPYANIIATKRGSENSPKIKALNNAVRSDEVRNFIINRYKGAVIPAF